VHTYMAISCLAMPPIICQFYKIHAEQNGSAYRHNHEAHPSSNRRVASTLFLFLSHLPFLGNKKNKIAPGKLMSSRAKLPLGHAFACKMRNTVQMVPGRFDTYSSTSTSQAGVFTSSSLKQFFII
jgi:hypothetical protein